MFTYTYMHIYIVFLFIAYWSNIHKYWQALVRLYRIRYNIIFKVVCVVVAEKNKPKQKFLQTNFGRDWILAGDVANLVDDDEVEDLNNNATPVITPHTNFLGGIG